MKILDVAGELPTPARGVPNWKSYLDLICILLSLPIWLPLMLLLMLLTRMASRGPVFYRQKRVGLDGKHFFIWKFRTMKVSAEILFLVSCRPQRSTLFPYTTLFRSRRARAS